MTNSSRFRALLLAGALVMAPLLHARTCSGNGDLIGGYGWIGRRTAEFVPVAATAPGTNVGSATAIGLLAAGAANPGAFASVGRVFLDGNGGVFASSTPLTGLLQVGTYSVNPDCTVSMTLTDTFATPGGAGLTPVQATATFEGVVVQNASEIELVQTGGATGTTVTLRKTRQFNGCSNDGLVGTFGFTASGVSTAPVVVSGATPVSTPFNLSGRINFDGQGNLVPDAVGLASPLTQRQFTGTYAVNADCTGTATLVGADARSRKINFVAVNPAGPAAGQALVFSFADTGVVGAGLAQQ